MESNNLIELINAIVEQFQLGTEYDKDALQNLVGGIRHELAAMAAQYEGNVPAGGEAVRELMVECIGLYDQALDEITLFMNDLEDDRPQLALQLAEEANDVLTCVEDLIQTQKNILSEMVEA